MGHYFLDTSALVKRYHIEIGSPEVERILDEPGLRYSIARLTLTEVCSVFAKKVRMGQITERDYEQLRHRFHADVRDRSLLPVRILNAHFQSAADLIGKHGKTRHLSTLDAIQLAAALSIRPTVDHFVCADQRLCEIAALEGLAVINPEVTP